MRKIRESFECMKKKSIKEDEKVEEAKDDQLTSTSRIRPPGEAVPESQLEKLKREELVMAKEMLKEEGYKLVEMEQDGNSLYRIWAH